jgi:hypothetical protein
MTTPIEEMRARIAAGETLGPVHDELHRLRASEPLAARKYEQEHAGDLAREVRAQGTRQMAASIFGQVNAAAIHGSGTDEQRQEQAAEKQSTTDAWAKAATVGPVHQRLAEVRRLGPTAEAIFVSANAAALRLEREAAGEPPPPEAA